MIPKFDERGYQPAGQLDASWLEFADRYAITDHRRALTVTKQQRDRLTEALATLGDRRTVDPLQRARIAALEADISKLDAEVSHYLAAVSGQLDFGGIGHVATVGDDLISARIAVGLSQEELAARVGSRAQQIQRYERDHYMKASLKTLTKVASAIVASHREREEEARVAQ
ncbi:helix-turn-helix transcriptional regulator [Sphingomonas sp. AR_OL41]|uniref:helix-turn-helix domain-containing protein n=1 Tax=Sphingomonas sp. AR_OL41 TaxID=3042729 RepID=UPI00247FFCEC|nr:helix-turn-helix transcriptional regulator [Sphingomonas sp. AR_OL41]MDH7971594.1 helix-turn-helix transcriptional regulator [Sphingomonas sp. AR_OL41]